MLLRLPWALILRRLGKPREGGGDLERLIEWERERTLGERRRLRGGGLRLSRPLKRRRSRGGGDIEGERGLRRDGGGVRDMERVGDRAGGDLRFMGGVRESRRGEGRRGGGERYRRIGGERDPRMLSELLDRPDRERRRGGEREKRRRGPCQNFVSEESIKENPPLRRC
jgi:hypothetical protein